MGVKLSAISLSVGNMDAIMRVITTIAAPVILIKLMLLSFFKLSVVVARCHCTIYYRLCQPQTLENLTDPLTAEWMPTLVTLDSTYISGRIITNRKIKKSGSSSDSLAIECGPTRRCSGSNYISEHTYSRRRPPLLSA